MPSGVTKPTAASLIAKSYLFKLRAYSGYFCGLVLAQIIEILLILTGASTSSFSTLNLTVTEYTSGTTLVLVFSIAWIFVASLMLASRSSKNAAFCFPGNRLTDSLSDGAFLLTACLFGCIATVLVCSSQRIVIFLFHPGTILAQGFYPTLRTSVILAAGSFFYMVLVSAVGYLSGTLIRLSKVFIVVAPALLLYIFFSLLNTNNSPPFWRAVRDSLFNQHSLALFALFTVSAAALFYAISFIMANRMEVKK